MACLLKILEKENRNKSEETMVNVLYMEDEYICGLIHKTIPNLEISGVKKVSNNYLEAMYILKKAEYHSRCSSCQEYTLFHATAATSVQSILRDNLDWRRSVRGSYGYGTYFADNAYQANQLCNPACGSQRAIIVCKVLVGETIPGDSRYVVPPNDKDTCTAYGGKVFVKFEDNEFLPMFVVYYEY